MPCTLNWLEHNAMHTALFQQLFYKALVSHTENNRVSMQIVSFQRLPHTSLGFYAHQKQISVIINFFNNPFTHHMGLAVIRNIC